MLESWKPEMILLTWFQLKNDPSEKLSSHCERGEKNEPTLLFKGQKYASCSMYDAKYLSAEGKVRSI